MKRFGKILVVLCGRSADRPALAWARRVAQAAGTVEVECLLVDPDPADWVPEYPEPAGGQEPAGGPEGEARLERAAAVVAEVLERDNPHFPALRSPQRLFQGPPAESKLLQQHHRRVRCPCQPNGLSLLAREASS